MTDKQPKAWVVYGTRLGYMVSRKKMTRTDAMLLAAGSSIKFDYQKELGFWHAERFISSVSWNPKWTEKEAQRYCDKENEELRKDIERLLKST